jgi:hypothetical protein
MTDTALPELSKNILIAFYVIGNFTGHFYAKAHNSNIIK